MKNKLNLIPFWYPYDSEESYWYWIWVKELKQTNVNGEWLDDND